MLAGFDALIGILVTLLLAVIAVAGRALTPAAGAVAAAFGIVVVLFGGFAFLALLGLFVAASSLATRYRFEEKKRQHVQEGRAGERGVSNVIAHILLPTGIAVAGGLPSPLLPVAETSLLFASALAFGASDTFASEFGVLAGTARSILSRRAVPPGTNGGVSRRGQLFAFVGSITTALVGLALFVVFRTPFPNPVFFAVVVTLVGFLACQVDSVLGELFENGGILSKGETNFLGMLSAVLMAAVAYLLLGTGL